MVSTLLSFLLFRLEGEEEEEDGGTDKKLILTGRVALSDSSLW